MATTTPSSQATAERIAAILCEGEAFLVAAHANPDGDALGATAALGWLLHALGKRFWLYNATSMPEAYAWLPLPSPLRNQLPDNLSEVAPTVVVLDSGDAARVGRELNQAMNRLHVVNIDHHLGNPMFGWDNWVDTGYGSVGEMIAEVAELLGVEPSGPLGECLYVAMVTDTGNFSYSNTTPRALRLAARIQELGLDPGAINARIENQWSQAKARLVGEALSGVTFHLDGRMAVVRMTAEMFARTGSTPADSDAVITLVRRIRGVAVAAALREEQQSRVKFSLRSPGLVNVRDVAATFGGGGHANAAGGQLEAPMDEAVGLLVDAVAPHMHELAERAEVEA